MAFSYSFVVVSSGSSSEERLDSSGVLISSLMCTQQLEMASVPGELIWEIVKRNNAFLVKQFGNSTAKVQFSKESNNLYNLNSYKHSGMRVFLSSWLPGGTIFSMRDDVKLRSLFFRVG